MSAYTLKSVFRNIIPENQTKQQLKAQQTNPFASNTNKRATDLYTAQVTKFAFVDSRIHTVEIDGNGELEEGIANCL